MMQDAGEGQNVADGIEPTQFSQSTLSVFARPLPYRLVSAARAAMTDAVLAGLFFAAALWWEAVFNHAAPSHLQVLTSSGWLRWWVDHGLIRVPPAAIAAVLFAVGLRTGQAPAALQMSRKRMAKSTVLYVGAAVLAGSALMRCPGGPVVRYPLFAAAVIVPWWWRARRIRRSNRRVRRPTRAGFRPSWRAVLSWRGRLALSNVDLVYPGWSFMNRSIEGRAEGEEMALFRRRHDPRSEAYCVARAVEYMLSHARIVDAEALTRSAIKDEAISGQPAVKAAQAQFLAVLGQHAEALRLLLEAQGKGRRAPAGLQVLILQAAINAGRYLDLGEWRWSEWRRAAMVWRRQTAAVVLGLAAEVGHRAEIDADDALRLAYQICRLPDRLLTQLPSLDFQIEDYESTRSAKGIALETAAEIYAMRGRDKDASVTFLDASEEFSSVKDRARTCRSIVRAYILAMTAGYTEPAQESHALDMIRVGLQVLEDDRGALRGEDSRVNWIAALRKLHADTFASLMSTRYHTTKAGEIGFWQLESLHRSMTADMMLTQGAVEDNPDLFAELTALGHQEADVLLAGIDDPGRKQALADLAEKRKNVMSLFGDSREAALLAEPTNIEAILERLGDRIAVIYHCWREKDGWVIHGVLASGRHGMHVHQGRLAAAASADVAQWLTPAGALDVLHVGDADSTEWLFQTPLADPVWDGIAQAVLPPSWRDIICAADAEGPATLLVVPDGPLASIPFSALPVRDGIPLLKFAAVGLIPSLTMLDLPGEEHHKAPGTAPVAVVHLDDREVSGLNHTAQEARHWDAAAQRMRVTPTADQHALEAALKGPPQPDIAAISTHGTAGDAADGPSSRAFGTTVYLRDGSVLSPQSALRLTWPATVILGACWVSSASVEAGGEPFGFPLVCLLGGASSVIGGVAPIPEIETAGVLCRLIDELPSDAGVPSLLREAQLAQLDRTSLSALTPIAIAGLTCWTTAPAAPQRHGPGVRPHWSTRGLPLSDLPVSGHLAPDTSFSQATQRVLAWAAYLAHGRPVGTLEFLAATFSADSADWASFTMACEIGEPTLPGSTGEAAEGTLTCDQPSVTITMPLATALHRGRTAAARLQDETMLPAHVVLAALADEDTDAAQWLSSFPHQAAAGWYRQLADKIFGTDLPSAHSLLTGDEAGTPAPVHERRMAGAVLEDEEDLPGRRRNWWTPAITAAVLLVIPANFALASHVQPSLHDRSALGVLMGPGSGPGPSIVTVLPRSPASRAGIRVGDVIIAVAGTAVRSVADTGLAIRAHDPGQRIPVTILRAGNHITVSATLSAPAALYNPGYLGFETVTHPRGALITTVAPASPAAAAGLRPGDIVTAISGYADGGSALGMALLIESHRPGQTVRIAILRSGRPMTVKLMLGP